MTIATDLFSALKSLVGNRMSPNTFPQPPAVPTWPAIRYSLRGNPIQDLCGEGDDDTADMYCQLDVVATTYAAMDALRLQVKSTLESFSPPARLEGWSVEYDAETQTHRAIMDYAFFGSSDTGNSP